MNTGATKDRIKTLSKAHGLNVSPHGVLARRPLRNKVKPTSTVRDPMHVVLANGVLNIEMHLVLQAIRGVLCPASILRP